MRRANGTPASPTAITNGQFLGFIDFTGYAGTAYASPNRVEIAAFATENWDATHQGSGIAFNVVTKGGTQQATGMSFIANSGSVGIGLFGTLGFAGVGDGTASIQTHEEAMVGNLRLGTSTGPTFTQGSGAPVGTSAVADLYLRNDGTAGAVGYIAPPGGSHIALGASIWNAGTVTTIGPNITLVAGTLSATSPLLPLCNGDPGPILMDDGNGQCIGVPI